MGRPPKQPKARQMSTGSHSRLIPDRCSYCGCSEGDACLSHGVPCCWVEVDDGYICSACAPIELTATSPTGRDWIRQVIASAELGLYPPIVNCQARRNDAARNEHR